MSRVGEQATTTGDGYSSLRCLGSLRVEGQLHCRSCAGMPISGCLRGAFPRSLPTYRERDARNEANPTGEWHFCGHSALSCWPATTILAVADRTKYAIAIFSSHRRSSRRSPYGRGSAVFRRPELSHVGQRPGWGEVWEKKAIAP
jgi:hypothetical protein